MVEKQQQPSIDFNDIYANYISGVVTAAEKADSITSSLDDGYYVPTGLHVLDFILNGGIRSGWFTTVGMEASGKTSLAVLMLGALARAKTPGYYIDAENSLNTDYACRIMNIEDLNSIFGVRSPTGKGWEIPPVIRYTPENNLEKCFTFMKRILLGLPDKVYRQDTKSWYLVFDDTKTDKAQMEMFNLKHDLKLYSETGRYWCKIPYSGFQFVFFVDSFASLVSAQLAEDADNDTKALALEARAFSKMVKQVRGLLRRKHAVVVGVNQLRDRPGVMFGSPTYETGGNALKFAADCRNELMSRTVPQGWATGTISDGEKETPTTKFGQEKSIEGDGVDKYAYKSISNIKSKIGTPFRKGWCRIWFSDYEEKARGFDPVYDCFKYLEMTNQAKLERKRGDVLIHLKKSFLCLNEQENVIDWKDFKALIVAEVYNKPDLCEKVLAKYKLKQNPNINDLCSKQLESGSIFEAMLKVQDSEVQLQKDVNDDIPDVDDENFDQSKPASNDTDNLDEMEF